PRPARPVLVQEVPPMPSPIGAVPLPPPAPSPVPPGAAAPGSPDREPRRRKRPATPPVAVVVASLVAALALLALPVWWLWPRGGPPGPSVRLDGDPPSATVKAGQRAEVALRFVWEGEGPTAPDLKLEGPASLDARVVSRKTEDCGASFVVQVSPARHEEGENLALSAVLVSEGKELARARARIDIRPWVVRLGTVAPVVVKAGSEIAVSALASSDDPLPPLEMDLENLPARIERRDFRLQPDGKLSFVLAAEGKAAPEKRSVTILLRDGGRLAARQTFSLEVVADPTDPVVPVPADRKLEMSGPEALALSRAAARKATFLLRRTGVDGAVTLRAARLPEGVSMDAATTDGDRAEVSFSVADRAAPGNATVTVAAMLGTERLASWDMVVEIPEKAGAVGIKPKPDEPLPVRIVLFTTADGLELSGRLWPQRRPKEADTVLILPDARKPAGLDETVAKLALALQKGGASVFAFDFRGQGSSRLRDDAIPPDFYRSAPANASLRTALARTQTTVAGRAKPPLEKLPASYSPWLVQDVIAARHHLDQLHDDGKVNSQNLTVVALGESGQVACLWLLTEALRTTGAAGDRPASRDVRAMLLVGVPPHVAPWSAKNSHQATLGKMATSLPPVHAVADSAVNGAGLHLADLLRKRGQAKGSTTTARGTPAAFGHALLGQEGMVEFVAQKAQKMPKPAWQEWESRDYRDASSNWTAGRFGSSRAKIRGDRIMQMAPLQYFGFPGLSNGQL
ncbi:MAG: hypothetical protein K2W96_23530, partial [Gemmataceae bacterium]|nr:hypothetical protein [Gemmataceae bacterium]